jgi:glycosyltransferase involved in cell wall biosynthesis
MINATATVEQSRETMEQPRPAVSGRVRLALVIDSIDAWETGTEQHIRKLISALDPTQFEPELYFLRPSTGLTMFPCRVHVAGTRSLVKWYRPETLINLVRLFRARQPHIVQTFFRDSTYYGITAARIAGIRARVISVRNTGYWMSVSDRAVSRLVGRWAVGWQCNSRSASEWLQATQSVAAHKITVLPNTVDLARLSPATQEARAAAQTQLGIRPAAPVIVSVASLRPVKDLPILIDAAAVVTKELPTAQLLLVGEGPDREPLVRQIRQMGLHNSVHLVGSQSEIRPYLAAADLGVLTSRSEASSNAVLEYLAAGLPSVLSDIPANRELTDEVMFEPGNAAQLATAIVSLWRDPVRRARLSLEYRARALQHDARSLGKQAQDYYLGLAEAYC